MTMLCNANTIGGGVDVGDIQKSLRFRRAASAYLSRTPASAGDRTKWTWSGWVKRGTLAAYQGLFGAQADSNNTANINFDSSDRLYVEFTSASAGAGYRVTSNLFRDPSALYHIVVAVDTTLGSNRIKIYTNGVETSYASTTEPSASYQTWINSANIHYAGRNSFGPWPFDGYLSRVCFVDGQALTPSSFGYLNTEINEWVSKSQSAVKAVVDAGGTNSFMLDFDNATSLTTLGYDKSSKGNNWTCNNISLTAGVTYDHMLDVPGNSYATWNPLDKRVSGTSTFADANLSATVGAAGSTEEVCATLPFSANTTSWVEVTCSNVASGNARIGIANLAFSIDTRNANGYLYQQDGQKYVLGAASAYGSTYTTADVIGILFDSAAGSITFYKQTGGTGNFVSQGAITGISTSATWILSTTGKATVWVLNAGQRPFNYVTQHGSLPSSAKALCQANLPDPNALLLDPTDHHIDITVTKSGDTNFTLPWNATTYDTFFEIKRRDAAGDWYQIDGLRGYDKILKSNSTAAETTDANVLGVSGTTCTLKSTLPNGTYVISATKAGLASARQTNTSGTITSTVSRNVDSGFSIVLYTGTGANATVGHGLGVAPKMVIVKSRNPSMAFNWGVYHTNSNATPGSYFLELNTTVAATNSTIWNSTVPTSAVFSLGNAASVNESGKNLVAYCFADSAIQKSFSYNGNASADGPNPFLGFKCGRWLSKNASAVETWTVFDSTRDIDNPIDSRVYPNLNNAEDTGTPIGDFLSNSIKVRVSGSTFNGSGNIIIGHAWAATTGKYALAR